MPNRAVSSPYEEFWGIVSSVEGVEIDRKGSRRITFGDSDERSRFRAPVEFRELGLIKLIRSNDKNNFIRAKQVLDALKSKGFEPEPRGLEFLFRGQSQGGVWVAGAGELRDESEGLQYDPSFLRLRYDVPCGSYKLTHTDSVGLAPVAEAETGIYLERGTSKARIIVGYSFPDDNCYF